MSGLDAVYKRIFDVICSAVVLFLTSWLILVAFVAASINTRSNGFFLQERVGKNGDLFKLIKIRTMGEMSGNSSTVTVRNDPRVTRLGSFFRRTKIDELPQLANVLLGHMSFVGPRPDVVGYANRLEGDDRIVLSVRPGITGPATLKYRNEEKLLLEVDDPEKFNREVLYPDKIRINRQYVEDQNFLTDMKIIWRTVIGE